MPIDTTELMKQVRWIRVLTNRLVDTRLTGQNHSVFKGQGVEFDEVREYVSGDDVRCIDGNVSARMGRPFVKTFAEERQLTVVFLIDISGSQQFGSETRSKSEVAAEMTCLLALSAVRNQDRVGMLLFSDRVEKFIPPRRGRTAVMRLVREALAARETMHGTSIAAALRFLNNVQKRRAVVFLISDFCAPDFDRELRVTARRHDIICCHVSDPRESSLTNAGMLEIQDPETGQLRLLDTASKRHRALFRRNADANRTRLRGTFRRMGIDSVFVSTARPFIDEIILLFRRRQSRAARG